MPAQARHPFLRVPRVAPTRILVLPDPLGGFGEGEYAVGAAFLGNRVAARAGDLPVGERRFARFPQRNERESAEPHVAAAAADDDPLDPVP